MRMERDDDEKPRVAGVLEVDEKTVQGICGF